jgi:hypothetical protein
VKAAYDASPVFDGDEALDGFQVTPGGALSYSQWCETDPDIADDFERRIIAGLRKALPKDMPAIWVGLMAKAIQVDKTRNDFGWVNHIRSAEIAYYSQPLWIELWVNP